MRKNTVPVGATGLILLSLLWVSVSASASTTGSRWPPITVAVAGLEDGDFDANVAVHVRCGFHVSVSVGETETDDAMGTESESMSGELRLAPALGRAFESARAAAAAPGRTADVDYISLGFLRFFKLRKGYERVHFLLGAELGLYDVATRDDDIGANLRAGFSIMGYGNDNFVLNIDVGWRYHYIGLPDDDLDFGEAFLGVRLFFGRRGTRTSP